MRDFLALLISSALGCAGALAVSWLYVAGIRYAGRAVLSTWRRWLFFPFVLAGGVCFAAPLIVPLYYAASRHPAALQDNAFVTLLMIFGIIGVIPGAVFISRHRHVFEEAGLLSRRNA